MKKLFVLTLAVLLLASLSGCGHPVEVPPAYVGKLSTSSGLQKGVIQPSKLRLSNFCFVCDSIILAQASDYGVVEELKIFMPKDQLNLDVDVRGVLSISAQEGNVEKIFERVTSEPADNDGRVRLISMNQVYGIYGEPVIREVVRSIITKYSIEEVMSNRDSISVELLGEIRKRLNASPITVIDFGLADIQPPAIIVTAQETRKEKEIEIERAEAQKQVSLKQAEAAYALAVKQQEVDLKEAETQALVNEKLAQGVTGAFIAQRSLRILEEMSKSPNKVFILPMEAFKNPSLMVGIANNAIGTDKPAGGQ